MRKLVVLAELDALDNLNLFTVGLQNLREIKNDDRLGIEKVEVSEAPDSEV